MSWRSAAVSASTLGNVVASTARTRTMSSIDPGWTRASTVGRRAMDCSAAVSRASGC